MKFTQFVKEYLVKNKDSGLTYREAMKDDGVRCAYKQFEADLCKAGIVRETEERPVAKRKYVKKPKVIEENITINENAPVEAPAQPKRQPSAPANIGYVPPPRTAPPRLVQPQQARVPSEDPFYQANPLLAQRAEEAIKQYNEMMGKRTAEELPAPVEQAPLRQKKTVTINPELDVYAEPAEALGGVEEASKPADKFNFQLDAPSLTVPQGDKSSYRKIGPPPTPPPAPSFSTRRTAGGPNRRTIGGQEGISSRQEVLQRRSLPSNEGVTELNEPSTGDIVQDIENRLDLMDYHSIPDTDEDFTADDFESLPPGPDTRGQRVDAGTQVVPPPGPDAGGQTVDAGTQVTPPPVERPPAPVRTETAVQTTGPTRRATRRTTPSVTNDLNVVPAGPTRRAARRTAPSITTDLNNVRNDIVVLANNGEIRPSDVENLNDRLYEVEEELDADEVSVLTSILAEDLQADPYNTPIPEGSVSPEGSVNSANVYEPDVNLGYRHFLDNRSQFGGVNPANDRGTTEVSDYHTGQSEEVGGDNPLFQPGSVRREIDAIEKRIDESNMSRGEIQKELTDIITDPKTGKKKEAYKSVKLNAKKSEIKKSLAVVSTQERRERRRSTTQDRVDQFAQELDDDEGKVDDRNVVSVAGESGEIRPRVSKRGRDERLNVIEEEEDEEANREEYRKEQDESYRRHMRSLPEGMQLAMRYNDLPEELQRMVRSNMDRDEFAPATEEELEEARRAISERRDSILHMDPRDPKKQRLMRIIGDVRRMRRNFTLEELKRMTPQKKAELILRQSRGERIDADAEGTGLNRKTDKLKKIMHALIDVSL